MKENNKPETTHRDGNLSVARWANTAKATDEKPERTFYTFSLERSYEKDGGLANSSSLNQNDLLKAANLLTEAYNQSRGKKKEQKSEQVTEE